MALDFFDIDSLLYPPPEDSIDILPSAIYSKGMLVIRLRGYLTILLASFYLLPAFTSAFYPCEATHINREFIQNDSQLIDSDSNSHSIPNSDNGPYESHHDCSHAYHGVSCCHSYAIFGKESQAFNVFKDNDRNFFERVEVPKPGPFLEGPFQPPRSIPVI